MTMPQQFINFEKKSDAVEPIPLHGMAAYRQVMIQGRILLERTAFVGHSFIDEDGDLVSFLKDLLAELSVRTLTGERAETGSISQKVKDRIAQAELFVGVLTRREQIGDTGE